MRDYRNEVTFIMVRKPFIAGNWKMHTTAEEARQLARAVRDGVAGVDGVVAFASVLERRPIHEQRFRVDRLMFMTDCIIASIFCFTIWL